jgi:hypothetical protein
MFGSAGLKHGNPHKDYLGLSHKAYLVGDVKHWRLKYTFDRQEFALYSA